LLTWCANAGITVGEITLDWFNLFKVLAPMRDEFAQVLMAEGCDEFEAREIAAVVMLAQMESIVLKMKAAMCDAISLLLEEARHDGVDDWRAVQGALPLPKNNLIKELTQEFEWSLRRRSHKTLAPYSRRAGGPNWQEIESAIIAWPTDDPPSLGEFATSLSRYAAKTAPSNPVERRKDRERAKSAMKKELALLKVEGFCPETNWPKLFKGVRSGQYPRYDPFKLSVDVDAGDESH
jgi:hypothetical protein